MKPLFKQAWQSLAFATTSVLSVGAQPAPTPESAPQTLNPRHPQWAHDWAQFSVYAERFITEKFKYKAQYFTPVLLFSIPDAVEQPVVWIGIYSRFLPAATNTLEESQHTVQLKLYPAIRAQVDGCLVVGDHVLLQISNAELDRWKKLKEGMAVRFSATLGSARTASNPAFPATTASIIRWHQNENRCSLSLVVRNPRFLEAW